MRRANRILLMAAVVAVGAGSANAALWGHRKADAPSAPAPANAPAAAMTLTGVEADAARVTLRTSGAPAYTSYSPAANVFVVDLTATSKDAALALPKTLPAGVAGISAEETTEMGMRLTRVTFRLTQPLTLQASARENMLVVTVPAVAVAAATPVRPAAQAAPPAPQSAAAAAPQKKAAAAAADAPIAVSPLPAESPAVAAATPVRTAAPAPAQKATLLRAVDTSGSGDALEVRLAANGAVDYKSFVLANPPRLVLDLEGVKVAADRGTLAVNGSIVRRVRVSQFKPAPSAVTRVVLDLATKAPYDVVPDGESLRIVFGNSAIAGAHEPTHATSSTPPAVTAAAPAPKSVAPAPAQERAKPAPPQVASAETTAAPASVPWPLPPADTTATAVINSTSDQTPPNTARQPAPTPAPAPAQTRPLRPAPTAKPENVFGETPADSLAGARPAPALGGGTIGAQQGGRSLTAQQKNYTGEPLSLNLKEVPIRDVLATFSDLTGLNIAVDPQVTGTVTVNFTDVPWDQALDIILAQNGLAWTLNGNVLRVGTAARLQQEREQARRLEDEERLNVPLETYIFKLSYAKAAEIQGLIKDVASTRAKIIIDGRTNQLIVSEIPAGLKTIASLIETVDVPTRQVMIEARIVEVTKTFTQQFGFQWGFGGTFDPAVGTGTGLIFPNRITYTGGPFNFGPGNTLISMHLFDVLGSFNLDFALDASESEGLAKIISAPRVTTQDNSAANIESGIQIPIQTRINLTTTVQYMPATLRLAVTPQITAAGTVIMDVSVQKNTPAPGLGIEGSAGTPIQTRTATTKLMVRDGGTAVIGGIYQVTDNNSQSRLPFVWNIPVIGNLFKTHNISTNRDELLIFITPRIVRGL